MGTAAVKIKSQLPKEEDENGLDWNSSRIFLQHPTEQHVIVAYVHTGQIIEDYDADFGSRTPVLVFDAVEHLGSILDVPEEVRRAFEARHARRTGGGVTLLDEPEPRHRIRQSTAAELREIMAGFDLDCDTLTAMDYVDLATGEVLDDGVVDTRVLEADEIALPESVEELTAMIEMWQARWDAGAGLVHLGESAGLDETVAYFRVASKRLDRYAAGRQADMWPTDQVASAVVRHACQIILGALDASGGAAINVRYRAVRDTISSLYEASRGWALAVPQLYGYLLDPLSDTLDRWAHEHPWDAGAMDLLGASS